MTEQTSTSPTASTPDHIVLLIPCPWKTMSSDALDEIFAEHWQELAHFTLSEEVIDDDFLLQGSVTFDTASEIVEPLIYVEPPLEGIENSLTMSIDPLTHAEALLLQQHQSIWRIVIPAGQKLGRRAIKRASQLMATFIEAGAIAVFAPGIMRLHSPRFIRKETMDLYNPQGMANLFVGAWHDDQWMRTRGLTAFELPEVEISVQGGMNSAYFNLMDMAANMLMQMRAFPSGSEIQMGHKIMKLTSVSDEHQHTDQEVPSNGYYGVQRLISP